MADDLHQPAGGVDPGLRTPTSGSGDDPAVGVDRAPRRPRHAREADRVHYENGEPLARRSACSREDGSIQWLRDEAILIRDDDGRPLWSQGILIDITERKQAEQHLHEAEERYRSLIETIPAATYIDTVDALSQAIYMSPQVEHIFGYTPEEWLRIPTCGSRACTPTIVTRGRRGSSGSTATGSRSSPSTVSGNRTGGWVWVHDQAVVIRDEDGSPRFCQGVMFDVTRAKPGARSSSARPRSGSARSSSTSRRRSTSIRPTIRCRRST